MPTGRDADLIRYDRDPFNAGAPLARLADELITPASMLYVRNHAAVPAVDPGRYRLRVTGLVARPLELSLAELDARFERVALVAAVYCAGNRRRELLEIADIPGETPWDADAVGNAHWSGWRLTDLLAAAGIADGARHVAFAGLDEVHHGDGRVEEFGGSVPVAKALAGEVLVADRLNGEPLPPLHGFPLRAVVPGYIGARSVKWLAAVEARADPSANHYQRRAYRLHPPHVTAPSPDGRGAMLGELPVTAAICRPADRSRVAPGPVELAGYALSGGGRRIERVELTRDGGGTWAQATGLERSGRWGWTLWRARLDLPAGTHRIAVRAVDEAANTQPERPIWNCKGYVNNAWHRVELTAR